MKKLACILMVMLLCGCQIDKEQLKSEITNELNGMADLASISYTTMKKPLYSYYLPKDVGRIQSNSISSLLMKDGIRFIMNFNPNEVVIHDYYHSSVVQFLQPFTLNEESGLFYEGSGTFKGSDGRYHNYDCRISELENGNYILLLDMEYVNFTAVLKAVQIKPLIHSMFVIAKSMQYDSKEIVSLYSLRSSSDAVMTDLEEFNEELPQNGALSELVNQKSQE